MLKVGLIILKKNTHSADNSRFIKIRRRNFQGMIFEWIWTCREIFKSASVYLYYSLSKWVDQQFFYYHKKWTQKFA